MGFGSHFNYNTSLLFLVSNLKNSYQNLNYITDLKTLLNKNLNKSASFL